MADQFEAFGFPKILDPATMKPIHPDTKDGQTSKNKKKKQKRKAKAREEKIRQ